MRNCNSPNNMAPSCRTTPYAPAADDGQTVAMAYVPWQTFGTPYDAEKGLAAGTIFPALDKPFLGRRAFRR